MIKISIMIKNIKRKKVKKRERKEIKKNKER